MSIGWKCPGCGRCYAPWVAECRPCSPPTTTSQPYPAPYPHGAEIDRLREQSWQEEYAICNFGHGGRV